MRFLILFSVHNITHYQGNKGLFFNKKGSILVRKSRKAVFIALNFARTNIKLLFKACTEIFRISKTNHTCYIGNRIFP